MPDDTQIELEEELRQEILRRKSRFTSLPLQGACLLLCLLNPLGMMGPYLLGAAATGFFALLLFWKWSLGDTEAIRQYLLWWSLWAGIVYLLLLFYRYRLWKEYLRKTQTSQPSEPSHFGSEAIRFPDHHPLEWQPTAEKGVWESNTRLGINSQGLCAFRILRANGKEPIAVRLGNGETPLLTSHKGDETRILYRLAQGEHTLHFFLIQAEPPNTAFLTQENDRLPLPPKGKRPCASQ